MFVSCGIWCLADVSSVSPLSEQTASTKGYHISRIISRPLFFSCKMMSFSNTLSISRLPQSLFFTYNCMNSYKIIDHIKSDKTKSKKLPV